MTILMKRVFFAFVIFTAGVFVVAGAVASQQARPATPQVNERSSNPPKEAADTARPVETVEPAKTPQAIPAVPAKSKPADKASPAPNPPAAAPTIPPKKTAGAVKATVNAEEAVPKAGRSVCSEFDNENYLNQCVRTCYAATSFSNYVLSFTAPFEGVIDSIQSNDILLPVLGSLIKASALPEDQARYVLSHVFGIALAVVWRIVPSSGAETFAASTGLDMFRQALAMSFGFFLCIFSFGSETILLVPMAVGSYIVSFAIVHWNLSPFLSVFFCVGYLCSYSWREMCTDYMGWKMTVSGPFMMLTIRCSTLVFQVFDGQKKVKNTVKKIVVEKTKKSKRSKTPRTSAAKVSKSSTLTPEGNTRFARIAAEQKLRAVEGGMPSFFEYFCWQFSFIGVLSVPCASLKEFRKFVKTPNTENNLFLGILEAIATFILSLVFLVGVKGMLGERFFPMEFTISEEFASQPVWWRAVYVWYCVWFMRYKYYGGFMMTEAASYLAGMREQTVVIDRSTGNAKSEYVRFQNNILIALKVDKWIGTEVSTTPAAMTHNWNRAAATWLRTTIYERLIVRHGRSLAMLGAYSVSALWHGLYPTYLISFLSLGLVQTGFEKVKEDIRFVLGGKESWPATIAMWMMSNIFISYCFLPFLIMDLNMSLRIWREQYYFGHVFALLAIVYGSTSPKKKKMKKG